MCAIFGLGFMLGHKVHSNKMIRGMVSQLTINSQMRGTDATGLAVVAEDKLHVIKKDMCASTFVRRQEYSKALEDHVRPAAPSSGLYSIIGHCRHETKGTYLVNENNHPIVRKSLVGVHNGGILNDDYLFKAYKMKRNAEVDSEAIFAMIEYFTDGHQVPIHQAIRTATARLSGSFACAMAHTMHPHIVWLFRRNNPCEIALYKDVGIVAWASCYEYITRAFKSNEADLGRPEKINLSQDSGIALDLRRHLLQRFDLYQYARQ